MMLRDHLLSDMIFASELDSLSVALETLFYANLSYFISALLQSIVIPFMLSQGEKLCFTNVKQFSKRQSYMPHNFRMKGIL